MTALRETEKLLKWSCHSSDLGFELVSFLVSDGELSIIRVA